MLFLPTREVIMKLAFASLLLDRNITGYLAATLDGRHPECALCHWLTRL